MKNLFLLLMLLGGALNIQAQNCMPDSSLPSDFIGISPLADSEEPCDTIVPSMPAEIGVAYETTFTIFVPSSVAGVVTINSVETRPANDPNPGLTGLPSGMTYTCEPPSCFFPAGQFGCLKVEGTPDNTNAPGIYDILIETEVDVPLLGGKDVVRFPLPDDSADYTALETALSGFVTLPSCPYQIDLRLPSSNEELFAQQVSVSQNTPNPFSGLTTINVNAEAGDYNFEVFNSIGERVHTRNLSLNGQETIDFDASNLNSGIYFYTVSNENGSITKRMIVQ